MKDHETSLSLSPLSDQQINWPTDKSKLRKYKKDSEKGMDN